MSTEFTHEDFTLVENLFRQEPLMTFSIFGYTFRMTRARRRWHGVRGNRVAVIVSHHDNAWDRRMLKGFAASVANVFAPEVAPEIDVFSGEGSIHNLHENVIPAIDARRDHYMAVVTMGAWTSRHVREYLREHQWNMLHIFMGVRDPVKSGIIESLDAVEPGVAGVYESPVDIQTSYDLLKLLYPGMQRVVIPHDSEHGCAGFDDDRRALVAFLREKGHEVSEVSVDFTRDAFTTVSEACSGADVLWSVFDPAVQLNGRRLVKFCERNKTLFCSHELATVFQGAHCGWGETGSMTGALAGELFFALSIKPDLRSIVRPVHAVLSMRNSMRINPSFIDYVVATDDQRFDRRFLRGVTDIIPLGWE